MFGQCRDPVWTGDDFTNCFQHDYLQTVLPLCFCAFSLLYIIFDLVRKAKNSKYYYAYTTLNSWHHVWDLKTPVPNGHAVGTDVEETTDIDDEIDRNAQLALNPTISQVDRTHYLEDDKPKDELVVVGIEFLAVIGQLVVQALAVAHGAWREHGKVAAIAGLSFWSYIFVLTTVRVLLSGSKSISFSTLWSHTAALYGLQWLITVVLFRSYIIHAPSSLSEKLMIANFALVSALTLLVLTSRKGNKGVQLEYEGDIPPAWEAVSSVFSRATFSWVDAIVYQGYKRTTELSDVWNLPLKDKAATVLSNYRQVKKTTLLSYHLLSYFKGPLIKQAIWAAFGGFLTFAPTLLLRAILQYVENPGDTPIDTAWFYVILLFASGVASALADGQALWIGRKICLRLRAIIVGEVYAKALKRKTGATGDKVLGEKADKIAAEKQGFFSRIFKGKKKDKKDDKTKEDEEAPDESGVSSGAIINLMAVDSFKVSEVCAYLHFLWASTPVQLAMCLALLYQTLGLSSLAGIVTMAFVLPVNMWIANQFASLQKKILAATDARIHTTNEVLTNIRIIKYFAWEHRYIATIDEKRRVELLHLRNRYLIWAFAATIWFLSPVLITFLSFASYTLIEKKPLIPSVAFTALSLFSILRIPLDQLADMVAHVQEAKVSVDRVEEFLSEEDTQKYKQLKHCAKDDTEIQIGFDNGTFSWANKAQVDLDPASNFRLMDLNMRFKVGQMNVVAGATGCGKTSLLMALLGEMTLLEGQVFLPGARSREDITKDPETGLAECVAYCAQQAWLANDTIKQNIIFASPWNPRRYNEVVRACALQKDFQILDAGDETLVGEKGVTLSGGQKQRVSLARALYSSARHVLLDDILSAVDSHTAKWIFEKALLGPLMQHRTCILVTHNLSLCLPEAHFAVLLENGRVVVQGTAEDVANSGKLASDMTKSTTTSRQPSRAPSAAPSVAPSDEDEDEDDTDEDDANGDANHVKSIIQGNTGTDKHATPTAGPAKATQTPSASAMDENKAVGAVNPKIIFLYLAAMGGWFFWLVCTLLFVAQQLASVAMNVWIRQWANSYTTEGVGAYATRTPLPVMSVQGLGTWSSCSASGSCALNLPFFGNDTTQELFITEQNDPGRTYYLVVYAVLGVVSMFITFFREAALFYGSLTASKSIHTRLISSVTHAKFRFFDSTPLGQIMNRFSKDIESIDQDLAPVAMGVVHCLFSIITVVVLISVITPGFLIAGVFITILYCLIGAFYINSSRDLKRLESTQRSPLFQQFGETLSGMTTIRAYGDERRYIRDNLKRVNNSNRPFIYLWATNRWLAFRVDVAGALVSFFAGVFVVLSVGRIDAGAAGLALTYAVTFTENVLWFVRLYAQNEQNMNSVERIKEYLDVEQEAPPIIAENRPPGDWPSKGSVEFVNYSTRYRQDLDLVLKNLTLKINPCEKIGVVGRTGAGKSSLALALFRALEAEHGKILIDGIDIGHIGLQDLRENIVMVPQDPTLFTGTIRSNLDPFTLFTDEEIFTALRRVHLIGSNTSAPPTRPQTPMIHFTSPEGQPIGKRGLDNNIATLSDQDTEITAIDPNAVDNKNIFLNLSSTISESGSNLSQGQRQLLCLARALLKSPKVLLMDEATASIDYATDAKVQDTIRELTGNTIITIAHRLKTIIDYDRVLVLEHGEVVEYGAPWELIKPLTPEEDAEMRKRQDAEQHERDAQKAVHKQPTRKEQVTAEGEAIERVGDEADVEEAVTGRPAGPKRWFREMCEMSGEMDVLEFEAKRSWDAKRLVDDS